ncbi:MAG: Lrp/AsnC family transcriptional regulator [Pseudomonadota bacterium]
MAQSLMDQIDQRLLSELQDDAGQSLDTLSNRVGLSRNACWNRIKRLEDTGVIRKRVALIDPAAVNLGLSVFIAVRTNEHDSGWLERFSRATREMPEILGVYRTSGDLDYLVHARVPDMPGYDDLYQRLIRRVRLADVSASFVMEEIKETTALPMTHVR